MWMLRGLLRPHKPWTAASAPKRPPAGVIPGGQPKSRDDDAKIADYSVWRTVARNLWSFRIVLSLAIAWVEARTCADAEVALPALRLTLVTPAATSVAPRTGS